MPRFFSENRDGDTIIISGNDARHIGKVLRMKTGETLTVSDMQGNDYECRIASIGEDTVSLDIIEKFGNQTEPDVKIKLYQAFPKGDKFDFIVQKSVEMGVTEIIPVLSARCVARPSERDFQKKRERYQRIALEAAKQCGRGIIPSVANIISLDKAIGQEFTGQRIVFYEGGGETVASLLPDKPSEVSVFIGSEGGFDTTEIKKFQKTGIRCATLGRRILRCETASIAALTLVLNAAGEL